jgi:hypothetical protein
VLVAIAHETNTPDDKLAENLRAAHSCDRNGNADGASHGHGATAWGVRSGGANEVVVVTDEDGRFCFRAPLDPDRYKATLTYRPTPQRAFLDGVTENLTFDSSRRGVALRFDPTPRIVQLENAMTSFEVVAVIDDDGSPRVAPGLHLTLANESGQIGQTSTDATGRAHFVVPSTKLGPPGRGELRVSFAGDDESARSSYAEAIERHARVDLEPRGTFTSPQVPEDGVSLVVDVRSSAGPVGEGAVEARVGDVLVGASRVEQGTARLTLTFSSPGPDALVQLRYVPTSPWYESRGEVPLRFPIRGPTLLSKMPILVTGLAVLAFFLVGRISAQTNKPAPLPSQDPGRGERDAKPGIDVVRPTSGKRDGWTGRVTDAHEGAPIAGARVWIERGTFEGRAVLASVETDDDGRFSLPHVGPTAGDERISAEGRHHSRFTKDLPPAGEIAVALSARRRAVLAQLVAWARRRGAPFDARPEPTPGHVRRAAGDDVPTSRWAEAVERAAFGPGEIDARTERDIEGLLPGESAAPSDDRAGQRQR